jgi:hypothetical protein
MAIGVVSVHRRGWKTRQHPGEEAGGTMEAPQTGTVTPVHELRSQGATHPDELALSHIDEGQV